MGRDEMYANAGFVCQKHLEGAPAGLSHALVAASETSFHIQRGRVLVCWYDAPCSRSTLPSKITNQLGSLCQCIHEAQTSG